MSPATVSTLAQLAGWLFDQTRAAHQIPARARPLIILAARTLMAARAGGIDPPDRSARDAILAADTPASGALDDEGRALAACAVSFQRDKLRAHRDATYLRLSGSDQRRAMQLAALLQLARAIEGAGAWPHSVRADAIGTGLLVGACADGVAPQIAAQALLWLTTIGPLVITECVAVRPPDLGEPVDLALLGQLLEPTEGDAPAAETARRILRRFFERMLAREEDVRKGEDPEDVHQMRVATRRLRASLQVVEGIFDPEQIRPFRRGLQRVARSLGGVRDLDVFLAALEATQGQPDTPAGELDLLIDTARSARASGREQMLAALRADGYVRFKRRFATFLTSHDAGLAAIVAASGPARVRDLAGSAIWRRYEELRAFEVGLDQAHDDHLHMARIAGKRLRYTLEFYSGALGPRVDELLDQLAALQEHLGLIQDSVAARAQIDTLGMQDDPGAQAYLHRLDARRAALVADLPPVWGKVASATYRRRLMELVIKM
jgi:CHAD domain-containing protein